MASFGAQVKNFTTEAKENTGKIFVRAIYKLESGIKKNIRKDTNNMGRSVVTSNVAMPQVDTVLIDDYPEVSFSIFPSDMGNPVYIGVQAIYAPRWEYGFVGPDELGRYYNQTGDYTIHKEGAKWQQFVTQAEAEIN